jgi:molybdopterin-guanine dinucleotide biosynthesis protein A
MNEEITFMHKYLFGEHMFSSAGIILAGGRSTRMGKDKALLPLPYDESVTFVEHLTTMLTAQCSDVVLVVRDMTQAALYQHIGIPVVTDDTPDIGPLMGLYTGLHAIHGRHAVCTIRNDRLFALTTAREYTANPCREQYSTGAFRRVSSYHFTSYCEETTGRPQRPTQFIRCCASPLYRRGKVERC